MTALLVSLGPDLYWWIGSLLTDGFGQESFGWTTYGICPGFELYFANEYIMYTILEFPLFWYGGAPLLLLGFAGWYLSTRRGRDRLGRTLAGLTATLLIARCLPSPLLYAYDTMSPDCAQLWDPLSFALGIDLYYLIPPILILLATRTPRGQRGLVGRRVAIVLTLLGTSVITAQSTATSKVRAYWELGCDGSSYTPLRGLATVEAQFLCRVRGHSSDDYYEGVPGWEHVGDREVLAQGRQLCDLAERHGGNVNAQAVENAPQASLAEALVFLCPAVAQAQAAEERRQADANDAYQARHDNACAAHPRHKPRIKPVRQQHATMFTEFWYIQGWENGFEGTAPDPVRDLVGSERGALTIWAADEVGNACLTAESYTRRPPLETKGWEEIIEVGYESPTGTLTLVDGGGESITGLTAKGPGSYRVRVHLRGRDLVTQAIDPPDGAVRLLIMVFPGEPTEPIIYK
ncbi:hypothetical protein Aple_029850 [Acrocarpospora pleiomorpha]|uniref:Uncharacterized protein n=1 Tax=Acrocarpospora pleiomorpha TaxID=90975 RepID=A0A5M3XIQ3_9ACTN|nr:hypothetical protein [Acrocarpospora pleiomorpha]GES20089.1 hypothetical protein Aple_029850 [Acrocarpospora pleiomorpha]